MKRKGAPCSVGVRGPIVKTGFDPRFSRETSCAPPVRVGDFRLESVAVDLCGVRDTRGGVRDLRGGVRGLRGGVRGLRGGVRGRRGDERLGLTGGVDRR